MKTMGNTQIVERFNEAVNGLYGRGVVRSDREIADKIPSNYSSFSQARKGDARYLTEKFISRFCARFELNAEWILTGSGEKWIHGSIQSEDKSANDDPRPPGYGDEYSAIIGLMKSNQKITEANMVLALANEKLADANNALAKANDQLAQANKSLIEANRVLADSNSRLTIEIERISSLYRQPSRTTVGGSKKVG